MLTTSEIVKKYALITKKSLGQNFLLNSNVTNRIVHSAGKLENTEILEIGPGPGGLTRSILDQNAKKLIVVEKDERIVKILNKELKPKYKKRLEIVNGDALKLDATKLITKGGKVIANLPYNISTKLLFNWLENINHFSSLTLMFQKEVGERLVAKPKTKDYGRISVIVQFLCDVKKEFDIKPSAFVPQPKVVSSVITIVPRKKPLLENIDIKKLSKICEVLFNQRRKIIKSKLKQLGISEQKLQKIGIDVNKRAEELSVLDYANLTLVL